MKPRLELLRSLLDSEQGSIWISIDDAEVHYLKVLCDQIFGRQNFVIQMTLKRSAPTGHKAINPSPIQVCDYILLYAKNKSKWNYKPQYTKREYDSAYSQIITNFEQPFEKWQFGSLKEYLKEHKISLDSALEKIPERIIRFAQPSYEGVGQETKELIDESKKNPTQVLLQRRENHPDIYLFNGNRILFYKDKLKIVDGELVTAELLTNLWLDIPFQGIAKEGDVVFTKSKKPEKMIKRIFEISTNERDWVLDSFLGSGTTAAVAHKINRQYIGIEMGDHAYSHVNKRLKSVVDGRDQSGISKIVNWKGGGGFKFFELAPSFITIDEYGNPVIEDYYNDVKLIRAMCKLTNYTFAPSQNEYWKHGKGQGRNFMFVTTQMLSVAVVQQIVSHLAEGETLLICPKKYEPGCKEVDSRITIKKIPQSVLKACQFGRKEYLLPIKENAMEESDDEDLPETQE